MAVHQHQNDFPAVQGAIYGVALSLDSFLVNGIPIGVIQRMPVPGFLEKVAGNLWTALADLGPHVAEAPVASHAQIRDVLAALRAQCQQLIDLVTGLCAFKTLPVEQVRARVSQVPLLRSECVELIQELERCFQTPKPFYQTRPRYSAALIDAFLANLPQLFEQERATSAVGAR